MEFFGREEEIRELRSAAVEEIVRMDAARRADVEKKRKSDGRGGVDVSRALTPNDGEEFMSAEEFFGEA